MSSAFGTQTNRKSTFFTPLQAVKEVRILPLIEKTPTSFKIEKDSDVFAAIIKPFVDIIVIPIYIVKCIAELAKTLYNLVGALYVYVNNAQDITDEVSELSYMHLSNAKINAKDAMMDACKVFSFIASFVQYFTRLAASVVYALSKTHESDDAAHLITAPSLLTGSPSISPSVNYYNTTTRLFSGHSNVDKPTTTLEEEEEEEKEPTTPTPFSS